jgi:hypothetical protein
MNQRREQVDVARVAEPEVCVCIDVRNGERRSQYAALDCVPPAVEQLAVVLHDEPWELRHKAALMFEEVHRVLQTPRRELVSVESLAAGGPPVGDLIDEEVEVDVQYAHFGDRVSPGRR